MLYLLCCGTALGIVLSMYLNQKDWAHPAVIYSIVFFISSLFCLIEQKKFEIHLNFCTVAVILAGIFAFLLLEAFSVPIKKNPVIEQHSIPSIKQCSISNIYILLLIIGQLISIYYCIRYYDALAAAYGELSGKTFSTLSQKIDLYDHD